MRWPTLASKLLRDADIPSTIARTTGALLTSAIGAADGVASLSSSFTPLDQMPVGWVHRVRWNGTWPASRPTSRTDITVVCEAPSSISQASEWIANAPAWLIPNDRFVIRDYDEPVGTYGSDIYGEGVYGG